MTDDAKLVDARGMRCPWPVLRAARAMRDSLSVIVLADDPIAPAELEALAVQHGWDYALVTEEGYTGYRLSRLAGYSGA